MGACLPVSSTQNKYAQIAQMTEKRRRSSPATFLHLRKRTPSITKQSGSDVEDTTADSSPLKIRNPQRGPSDNLACSSRNSKSARILNQIHGRFSKYDEENKGYLDMKEFSKLLHDNAGNVFSEQEIHNLLQMASRSEDKSITLPELMTFYRMLINH